MQTVHFLKGVEGCGIKAENGIRQQFFQILDRVVKAIKYEDFTKSSEYVHCLNALCWNFNREDHPHMVKLEIFLTLQRGDGTLMHPLNRSWGQEYTPFQLELEKDNELALAPRLRQVFEFLVQNVLESLFVKKDADKLEVGGDDAQEQMVGKTELYSQKDSEILLTRICDVMFTNANKYLRMKELFPKSQDFQHTSFDYIFNKVQPENDKNFDITNRCGKDLAEYINRNGGPDLFRANRKLARYFNDMKV